MKKKRVANIVMVAVIIVIAAAGIFGVGHIKGWFDKSDDSTAVLTDFCGIITLQRDGVAYATTDDTVLRENDKITCDPGATVKITLGDGYITLGQNADAEIINPSVDEFVLKVNGGEAFANTNQSVLLEFDGKQTEISNSVVGLSVRKGAQSICVYQGFAGEANEGQMVEWLGDNQTVRAFSVKSLNDFNISQIRKANETKTLVFSNADLDKLEDERWEQMHGSTETTDSSTTEPAKSTYAEKTTQSEKTTKKETTSSTTAKKEPTATVAETTTKPTTSKTQTTTEKTTKKRPTTTRRDQPLYTSTSTSATTEPVTTTRLTTTTKPVGTTKEKLTCTITIRCDTILYNMDNLEPAKAPYVPYDGVVLRKVTVEFKEGETVFDVLNRVCKEYNIPIEYSWTPMYDSYYIEGINNLYEFDCGTESGWMYKVNGWFPNYGCSSCYLTGGEEIVWCYTCNGLGEDVGAERWE